MSSRNAERRPYSNIKNRLENDLNNLKMTFTELNEQIHAANGDLGLFFRSMEDRGNELFEKSLGAEEKYA